MTITQANILKYVHDNIDVRNTILALAAKNKQVIYGAQSVNMQLPDKLKKETKDYDILTKDPEGSAKELAEKLNKIFGKEKFKVTPAIHKGTFKVKDEEGNSIADYTHATKKPKSIGSLGVRYANLDYQKSNIRKSLKNPEAAFRREKDLDTRARIKEGTKKIFTFGRQ